MPSLAKELAELISTTGQITVQNEDIVSVANTKLTGLVTDDQIAGVANTKLTGLVTNDQIASVSNTKITGTLGGNYVMQTYTSPATWTKPDGLKAVKVTVVGGGGGSGAGPQNGMGGGGGGASFDYIDAPAIPGPISVTVGGGGAAGTAPPAVAGGGAGGTGGTSSFGPICSATGGVGGSSGPSVSGIGIQFSNGGIGSGGELNIRGGLGSRTVFSDPLVILVGAGGSIFGGGLQTTVSPQLRDSPITPAPNRGYGVGGLGLTGSDGGLAGSGGLVIVEEFY